MANTKQTEFDFNQVCDDVQEKREYEAMYNAIQQLECNDEELEFDEYEEDDSFSGKALSFLKKVGKNINESLEKNTEIMNAAYEDGMSSSNRVLIRKFKDSSGARKMGYKKALEDKELLFRDAQGSIKGTSEFQEIYKNV